VDRYRQLAASFPVCPPSSGPTGFSYFRGDPTYDNLVATDEAWSWFVHAVQSEVFVSYCLRQFANFWSSTGCLIDTSHAHYVDYSESRADKERRHIEKVIHAPEELWVRLDILQARVGYRRKPHLDHRRRLVTMLIYFCDSAENQMIGGALVLHGAAAKNGTGEDPEQSSFAPRQNFMAAFPCTPESFHSVTEIKSQSAPRNFVQITISSSVDAWPS
jgi:hypothetical protein